MLNSFLLALSSVLLPGAAGECFLASVLDSIADALRALNRLRAAFNVATSVGSFQPFLYFTS